MNNNLNIDKEKLEKQFEEIDKEIKRLTEIQQEIAKLLELNDKCNLEKDEEKSK